MFALNKIFKPAGIVLIALALTACGADVRVKTSLQGTKDVSSGEKVYLDNQVVGKVVDIDRNGDETLIEIELDASGVNSVKSEAAVVVNRLKKGSPLEIHNRQGSSEPVVDGQELAGLDSMFQLGAWMVGDSIDLGSGAISDYVSSFQKYLEGDEWEKSKQEFADQATQAAKVAEQAIAGAGDELSKVVEEVKKAEEPIAQAVEQLGQDLAPVISELGKSGQSIMQELEKLTQNLEDQTNANDREVGSRFFESLNKTLETLNESLEESLNEANSGEPKTTVPDSNALNELNKELEQELDEIKSEIESNEKLKL